VVVLAATLGTASVVAVSGLIGFVGIIVPHAVRLLAGASYRRVLPWHHCAARSSIACRRKLSQGVATERAAWRRISCCGRYPKPCAC